MPAIRAEPPAPAVGMRTRRGMQATESSSRIPSQQQPQPSSSRAQATLSKVAQHLPPAPASLEYVVQRAFVDTPPPILDAPPAYEKMMSKMTGDVVIPEKLMEQQSEPAVQFPLQMSPPPRFPGGFISSSSTQTDGPEPDPDHGSSTAVQSPPTATAPAPPPSSFAQSQFSFPEPPPIMMQTPGNQPSQLPRPRQRTITPKTSQAFVPPAPVAAPTASAPPVTYRAPQPQEDKDRERINRLLASASANIPSASASVAAESKRGILQRQSSTSSTVSNNPPLPTVTTIQSQPQPPRKRKITNTSSMAPPSQSAEASGSGSGAKKHLHSSMTQAQAQAQAQERLRRMAATGIYEAQPISPVYRPARRKVIPPPSTSAQAVPVKKEKADDAASVASSKSSSSSTKSGSVVAGKKRSARGRVVDHAVPRVASVSDLEEGIIGKAEKASSSGSSKKKRKVGAGDGEDEDEVMSPIAPPPQPKVTPIKPAPIKVEEKSEDVEAESDSESDSDDDAWSAMDEFKTPRKSTRNLRNRTIYSDSNDGDAPTPPPLPTTRPTLATRPSLNLMIPPPAAAKLQEREKAPETASTETSTLSSISTLTDDLTPFTTTDIRDAITSISLVRGTVASPPPPPPYQPTARVNDTTTSHPPVTGASRMIGEDAARAPPVPVSRKASGNIAAAARGRRLRSGGMGGR